MLQRQLVLFIIHYAQMNVAGTVGTNSFIKNRLSAIEFHHKASAGASDEKFVFPVTALSFDYNNNITLLNSRRTFVS